jgi:hypothetical protein
MIETSLQVLNPILIRLPGGDELWVHGVKR